MADGGRLFSFPCLPFKSSCSRIGLVSYLGRVLIVSQPRVITTAGLIRNKGWAGYQEPPVKYKLLQETNEAMNPDGAKAPLEGAIS